MKIKWTDYIGVFALLIFFLPNIASALIVNFEDIPHEPTNGSGDIISTGFLFDLQTDHYHVLDHTYLSAPANGTTWFAIDDNSGDNPTTMSEINGEVFSLSSIDLAEWFSAPSTDILITGNYASGGNTSKNIQLDQVWDGLGGDPDFETFTFDNTWANLSSVIFDSVGDGNGAHQGWAIDNITINTQTVSEPSILWIMLSGLLTLTLTISCRKSWKIAPSNQYTFQS